MALPGQPSSAHTPKKKRRKATLFIGAGLFLVGFLGVASFVGLTYGRTWLRPTHNDVIWYAVKKQPLQVTIVEKGQLEAAKNDDLKCLVKATRGNQLSTTIRWVIDDGTQVMADRPEEKRSGIRGDWVWPHHGEIPKEAHAGKPPTSPELNNPAIVKEFERIKVWSDLLCELDKSGLEDQQLTQMIEVNKAESDVVGAKAQLEIDENQNKIDIDKAELTRDLAKIDLDKYIQCDRGNSKADLEGQLEQAKDKSVWSRRMTAKGYVSFSQAEADRLALEKIEGSYRALTDFQFLRDLKNLQSLLAQAKLSLNSVEAQAKAKILKSKKDLETKQNVLKQQQEKLKDLEEQIINCRLYAPRDGMVVYYMSEQQRSGFGSQQSVIAQGEPVREGQTLIRIPDLDHMMVNTRVHEAMVDKVKPGMPVEIRVDAFQDRVLKASVRQVATVAMQPDWRASPDVKMYQTMVSIDEPVRNLKPGMNAEVKIFVDTSDKPVLTVPIQAVIGGPELGDKRKIFVKNAAGQPEERDIKVGINNEKEVEIRDGLQESDEVVLNPKVLIGDTAKTRQPGDFEKKNKEQNGEGKPGAGKGGPGAPAGGPKRGPGTQGTGRGGATAGGGRPQFDMSQVPPEWVKKFQDPEWQKKMRSDPSFKAKEQEAMKAAGLNFGGGGGGGGRSQ